MYSSAFELEVKSFFPFIITLGGIKNTLDKYFPQPEAK